MTTVSPQDYNAMSSIIITIDGPAGSGKSTLAKLLASRLGFDFLDTGAMYRAVAWASLQANLMPQDTQSMGMIAAQLPLRMQDKHVFINDTDVTLDIRHPDVAQMASIVASVPAVREALVTQQRTVAQGRRMVTEGRDQGSVVFPDAVCKFFLTASPVVRASRRYSELTAAGREVDFETLLAQQQERDERDQNRACSPLVKADGALEIDTSDLTPDEVLAHMEQTIRSVVRL